MLINNAATDVCIRQRDRSSTTCSELFTSSDEDYDDHRSDGAGIDEFFSRIDISSAPHDLPTCGRPKTQLDSLIDLEGEAVKKDTDDMTEERRWMKNFAEPDGPDNIVFDEHEILAATKEKLIISLTTENEGAIQMIFTFLYFHIGEENMDGFFMTFRLFMEPTELARMIGFRLRMAYMLDCPENQRVRLMQDIS